MAWIWVHQFLPHMHTPWRQPGVCSYLSLKSPLSMLMLAMQNQWHVYKRLWIQPLAQVIPAKNRNHFNRMEFQDHVIGKHLGLSLGHPSYK